MVIASYHILHYDIRIGLANRCIHGHLAHTYDTSTLHTSPGIVTPMIATPPLASMLFNYYKTARSDVKMMAVQRLTSQPGQNGVQKPPEALT